MNGYKVSYKVLRQQGDDMKAVAKLIDGYGDRVTQISSKLGEDNMLAEVRSNLQKLCSQLGESRAILNASGDLLIKSIEDYGSVETRQIKKVDATKAHSRDFYKNPVVVASAGAGVVAGTAAIGGASGSTTTASTSTTTLNYTDNSVTVNMVESPEVESIPVSTEFGTRSVASSTESPSPSMTGGNVAGIAGGVAAGTAATAGAVFGGKHIKKKKAEKEADIIRQPELEEYDPEVELEKAIRKVAELEED